MKDLLKEMHTWMANYMKSFYTEDEEVQNGIRLKELHTGYVTAHSRELAAHLGLDGHHRQLAEIVGLFHDVGRFRQYT
ncbi:MAG: metal-dependent phosphohydrolase, partial [Selenomonadaceae bacterium]|nr:metal-dependent phosphohydrolase [Selenomonadaceae bacterium]